MNARKLKTKDVTLLQPELLTKTGIGKDVVMSGAAMSGSYTEKKTDDALTINYCAITQKSVIFSSGVRTSGKMIKE